MGSDRKDGKDVDLNLSAGVGYSNNHFSNVLGSKPEPKLNLGVGIASAQNSPYSGYGAIGLDLGKSSQSFDCAMGYKKSLNNNGLEFKGGMYGMVEHNANGVFAESKINNARHWCPGSYAVNEMDVYLEGGLEAGLKQEWNNGVYVGGKARVGGYGYTGIGGKSIGTEIYEHTFSNTQDLQSTLHNIAAERGVPVLPKGKEMGINATASVNAGFKPSKNTDIGAFAGYGLNQGAFAGVRFGLNF